MAGAVRDYRLPLSAMVMAGSLAAGFFLFWRTASPLSAWVGVDLDFLFPPLAAWTVPMLLSRLSGWAAGTSFASTPRWPGHSANGRWMPAALTFAERSLCYLAWSLPALASVAVIPAMVDAIHDRGGGPDLSGVVPYVRALGELPAWGLPLLAIASLLRAAADIRPELGSLFPSPWTRLAALGAGYVLLAEGGVVDAAFGVAGFTLWQGFAGALGIAYAALAVRRTLTLPLKPSALRLTQLSLLTLEAAWVIVAFAALTGMPGLVEAILIGHFGLEPARADAYVLSLRALTSPQAVVFLLPFMMVRMAGVYWPRVDAALGFPAGHLALFGAAYALFSENGTLSTGLQVSGGEIMSAVTIGLALSYAAFVMRNVGDLSATGRFRPAIRGGLGLGSAVLPALAAGMVIEVLLNHLPIANAALLDYTSTREFGHAALPYFGALLDSRAAVAALGGAMVFAWNLPWNREDAWFAGQPMLNAVCYGATGCLAWLTGAALSQMGHGLLLAGATTGAGFLVIALVQVFGNEPVMRNATLSPVATWLTASRARGLVLGGAAAVYLMILRPALYEVLWFAALYEYIAVLALLVVALLFVMGLLRRDAVEPEAAEQGWSDWTHHRQTLESKDDPRTALAANIRQRFVDFGEWKPLWSYIMGLLYHGGASQERMCDVCRPLRASAVTVSPLRFLQRGNLRRLARAVALSSALRRTDSALAERHEPARPMIEADIRAAAEPFINTGASVERLAIALTVAHCQQGVDIERAVDRWFPLLDTPDPASVRFPLPWVSRAARLRDRHERVLLVDRATAMIFGSSTIARDMAAPESLAELVGAAGGGGRGTSGR